MKPHLPVIFQLIWILLWCPSYSTPCDPLGTPMLIVLCIRIRHTTLHGGFETASPRGGADRMRETLVATFRFGNSSFARSNEHKTFKQFSAKAWDSIFRLVLSTWATTTPQSGSYFASGVTRPFPFLLIFCWLGVSSPLPDFGRWFCQPHEVIEMIGWFHLEHFEMKNMRLYIFICIYHTKLN